MGLLDQLQSERNSLSRRAFLKASGGATAGLVVGFALPPSEATAITADSTHFNPFVRIAPDGRVTVLIKHLDKGQGTLSALTTLVAEELDADWDTMSAEFAPAMIGAQPIDLAIVDTDLVQDLPGVLSGVRRLATDGADVVIAHLNRQPRQSRPVIVGELNVL